MRRFGPTILFVLVASLAVHSAPSKPDTNYDLTGWRRLAWSSNRIVASGGAPLVTSGDGKLRLSATKIVLTMTGKAKGRQTISTAEAVGSVKIHAVPGPEQVIDAVCQKAVIHPSSQRAELIGSVKVSIRNRTKFGGPAELSSEKVELNLKDGRVVATSPSSRGRFRAAPAAGKGR